MKIAVIGTGYVGLVTGACFAEFGYHVTCIDKDVDKITALQQGDIPIFEPGLDTLVKRGVDKGRLHFAIDGRNAINTAQVVFIAVGTPPDKTTGHADLSYVFDAVDAVIEAATEYTIVVTKSTVPVDTANKLEKHIAASGATTSIDVVSNPEFLREGSAIDDFMTPDRVVIGTRSEKALKIMKDLYRPLDLKKTPLVFTSPESSELIKYASNSFLATKIAFINEMADLCEKTGAHIDDVAKGMGLDTRIGRQFLQTSPGYGGSCFPKDTLALSQTAHDYDSPLTIVDSVIKANDTRKHSMAHRVRTLCGGSLHHKRIAVLGITFKPNTDDMRDSPSLHIIPTLQEYGAHIAIYDPEGMKEGKQYFSNVSWEDDTYAALTDADIALILTEWNDFRYVDLTRLIQLMRTPLVIDFRNIYSVDYMKKHGITYHSLGRPSAIP